MYFRYMALRVTDPPIVVEQMVSASIEQVWKSITELSQMREWFFAEIPDFKAAVGFETVFDIQAESNLFPHHWTVMEVEDRKRLKLGWKYDGFEGDGQVTFELMPQDDNTLIRLTNVIIEDFQSDIPEFSRESAIGGWQYFINNRLREHLEK